MKCILINKNDPLRVPCFGKNEKELNADINLTIDMLKWNRDECSTVEQDW